ncbi:MAG: anthranilate synthase component I [Thermoanaerobaculia bacterium]
MTPREVEKRRFASRAKVGRVVPVARAFVSDTVTPVALLQRMRRSGRECFLLESVEGGETAGRYTFLGCGPQARFEISGEGWRVAHGWHSERHEEAPLRALERLVSRPAFEADPDLPSFSGGAVGFLGYDAVRLFEAVPDRHPREGKLPDGLFLLFDAAIAFDHARQRLLLLTEIEPKRPGEEEREVEAAIERLDRLEAFLRAGPEGTARPLPETAGRGDAQGWKTLLSREEFLANVERAREAILSGEVYQVVLSQRWTSPLAADPFDAYRALRALNPSPYLFYLETREAAIFGASPEMLVRCRGREVSTRPIAGTAPRGASPEEDAVLEEALLSDPKERAEHVMLVDLARNDLGRVCEIGSVRVSRYAGVEKYSHVQHLVSEVSGRLAQGKTAADALAACFPAGTLTGAPKIRAMELIDAWEGARRGVYGGAVGYLDHAGNLDMAIAIRAGVVEGEICRVQAGAGIVADSVPEKEYREAESKAEALFRAVDIARSWSEARATSRPGRSSPVSRLPSHES